MFPINTVIGKLMVKYKAVFRIEENKKYNNLLSDIKFKLSISNRGLMPILQCLSNQENKKRIFLKNVQNSVLNVLFFFSLILNLTFELLLK